MRALIGAIVLAMTIWASQAAAEDSAPMGAEAAAKAGAAPTCLKAEVNPVTGHALCIQPLGAPVDSPPPELVRPCQPHAHTAEDWSYAPSCKSEPAG